MFNLEAIPPIGENAKYEPASGEGRVYMTDKQ